MPRAKKMPSGNWRCRVYSYTDENGSHYTSFTAATKAEAEAMAARYTLTRNRHIRNDLTVGEAIDQYISAKEGVLSPPTIRSYRSMQTSGFKAIERMRVKYLKKSDIQNFISQRAREVSPKTVKNTYSLLTASLRFCDADLSFNGITLPTVPKRRLESPTDEQVGILYAQADDKLKLCIALAAFGSLRRGEICALQYKDVNGNMISVHSDMVRGVDGWVHKPYPKTSDSVREVMLPNEVISLIGSGDPEEYIAGYLPRGLSAAFERLTKKLQVSIRFHDLRHYYASVGAVLNIPDTYLASFGGWRRNSPVLKEVYQNRITTYDDLFRGKMSKHFEKVMTQS